MWKDIICDFMLLMCTMYIVYMMQSCIQRNYKSEFYIFFWLYVIDLCRPNLPMFVYETTLVLSLLELKRC